MKLKFIKRKITISYLVILLGLAAIIMVGKPNKRTPISMEQLSKHAVIESLGKPLIQLLSLSEAGRDEPFNAKVESKSKDETSITAYLRKEDGTKLAIREEIQNTTQVAILDSLAVGTKYRFPFENRNHKAQ